MHPENFCVSLCNFLMFLLLIKYLFQHMGKKWFVYHNTMEMRREEVTHGYKIQKRLVNPELFQILWQGQAIQRNFTDTEIHDYYQRNFVHFGIVDILKKKCNDVFQLAILMSVQDADSIHMTHSAPEGNSVVSGVVIVHLLLSR